MGMKNMDIKKHDNKKLLDKEWDKRLKDLEDKEHKELNDQAVAIHLLDEHNKENNIENEIKDMLVWFEKTCRKIYDNTSLNYDLRLEPPYKHRNVIR